MTYKQIVTNIIKREAERYARVLFETAGIESPLLFTSLDELEKDPKGDLINFKTIVEAPVHYNFFISGYIDAIGYVTFLCVRNDTKDGPVIWAESPATREALNISYFKLS